MTREQTRAWAAVAIVGSAAIADATSLGRHSFSSSIIASAMARFHRVKDPNQGEHRSVATSVQVVAPAVKTPQDPLKQGNGLPPKDGPPPIVATVKAADSTPPGKGASPKTDPQTNPPGQGGAATTGAQTTKAQPQTTTAPSQGPATPGMVNNVYVDTDIKAVMNDAASSAGVVIIADESVKAQEISINFSNVPIETAVNQLALLAGGYWIQSEPGVYLISKATTDASFFPRFAQTTVYHVKNQSAASIQALLSVAYKLYVSVDPKTDAITICAPKVLHDKILADIDKADKQGRQIQVEALVTEVSLEDALQTGFTLANGNWSLGSTLGINFQTPGVPTAASIQAFATNHKMRLRANPNLITTEGVESTVNVGQDTYYSLLSGSTIYPTSQIQLIHTGVILKFTATVADDGKITMQLDPSVSDAVVSVNGNPTSNIRSASNKVTVKSGQTIVIAGLVQETGSRQVIRVPILGYIPIIGEIFTQRNYDKKKIETVFFITPKLVPGS